MNLKISVFLSWGTFSTCLARWNRAPLVWRSAAAALAIWASSCAAAAGQSAWELSPYRMRLVVVLAPDAGWAPHLEAELGRQLVARCDAVVGAIWDAEAAGAPSSLRQAFLSDLNRVEVEALPGEWLAAADKVAVLVVTATTNGHQVCARQLDVRTRFWSPTVRKPVWQRAKLRDVAFRAVVETFAPLARIERGEDKRAVLRPRGGGLPPRDDSPVLLREGDVFLPVVRSNDREGKPRGIRAIPWTFLTVDEVFPRRLECPIHSGLRNPLSGRRRGRIEWLALGVIPPGATTRLTLRSRTDREQVLSGYDVVSHPPNSKTTERIGRTDSRGAVIVRPGNQLLRILVVSSGNVPLARLPIVPGFEPQSVAIVPNNDDRLEAEGFVTGLQEQLVDLVTRREVLLARTRARIQAGKLDEAAATIDELEALKRVQADLDLELIEQKEMSFSSDPMIQAKIDALFADTRKLLTKHLSDEPVKQIADELRQARK